MGGWQNNLIFYAMHCSCLDVADGDAVSTMRLSACRCQQISILRFAALASPGVNQHEQIEQLGVGRRVACRDHHFHQQQPRPFGHCRTAGAQDVPRRFVVPIVDHLAQEIDVAAGRNLLEKVAGLGAASADSPAVSRFCRAIDATWGRSSITPPSVGDEMRARSPPCPSPTSIACRTWCRKRPRRHAATTGALHPSDDTCARLAPRVQGHADLSNPRAGTHCAQSATDRLRSARRPSRVSASIGRVDAAAGEPRQPNATVPSSTTSPAPSISRSTLYIASASIPRCRISAGILPASGDRQRRAWPLLPGLRKPGASQHAVERLSRCGWRSLRGFAPYISNLSPARAHARWCQTLRPRRRAM